MEPAAKVDASSAPAAPRARRVWLFRLAAATVMPALFFGVLELSLRLTGYGHPTAYFLDGTQVGVASGFVENRVYARRFFPPSLVRVPPPLPFALPSVKPAGTYRIFVLGESAAQGFPDPSISFARVLEVMLGECYPDTRFEVVNTAMVAINSHVVLSIARECVEHDPDLLVLLMGNNEVVGPFGAAGVLGAYAPHRGLIRANLAAKTTRTGQLMDSLVHHVGAGRDRPLQWNGMATFAGSEVRADNEGLRGMYDHFRANLQDICATARDAGVPIVVCTVPVNLRDCPPFASAHRVGLDGEQLAAWESAFQQGVRAEAAHHFAEAADHYRSAAAVDAEFAELAFRRGRCHAALGQREAAQEQFVKARDLDTLRFRCDTTLNNITREVCAACDDDHVRLADAEKAFAAHGSPPVVGAEFFLEHVHFNFQGNCLLARTVFEAVQTLLPTAPNGQDAVARALPSEAMCAARLAWTPWNEGALAAQMRNSVLLQPPFTNQLDYNRCLDRWDAKIQTLGKQVEAMGLPKIVAAYEDAVRRAERDWMLRMSFGKLLSACGKRELAIAQYEAALQVLPQLAPAREQVGRLLLQLGRGDDAVAQFRGAVAIDPQNADAQLGLAEALAALGETNAARDACAPLLAAPEDRPKALLLSGTLAARAGRIDEARDRFTELVRLRPDEFAAYLQLGELEAREGNIPVAIGHFQAALRLRPNSAEVRARIAEMRTKAPE